MSRMSKQKGESRRHRKIGRYDVQALIGRGESTTVVRAHDPNRDQPVAIKLLPKAIPQMPSVQQPLQDWIHAMTAVPPPHVVPILDSGVAGGHPYLVMPAWQNRSLARKINAGALPRSQTNAILTALAAALVALHNVPRTHGNLTPQNVFVHGKNVWLSDIGLRPILTPLDDISSGTPGYVSPEQIAGQPPNPRSDFYALGILLYQALTGTPPYRAETAAEITMQQMSEPVPSVHAVDPSLPPRYDGLIQRLTAVDPADRPQTANDVQEMVMATIDPDTANAVDVDDTLFEHVTQYYKREETLAERLEQIDQIRSLKSRENQSSAKRMAELMAIEEERQKILRQKLAEQRQKERRIIRLAIILLAFFLLIVAAYVIIATLV